MTILRRARRGVGFGWIVTALLAAVAAISTVGQPATISTAQAAGSPIPEHVGFRRIASFDSLRLEYGMSWSPVGQHLALFGEHGGVFVFDVERPTLPPRHLLDTGGIKTFCWSPDGRWLLLVVGSQPGFVNLVTVPIEGGAPIVLRKNLEAWPAIWSSTGDIYYWEDRTGRRYRVAPPAAWRQMNPNPLPPVPTIVYAPHDHAGSDPGYMRLRLFLPAPIEMELPIPALEGATTNALLNDALPSGTRFLINASQSLVLDGSGKLVGEPGRAGLIYATSLSADGTMVVGQLETISQDGHKLEKSSLYLIGAMGGWRLPIAIPGSGTNPQLSRHGLFLVYEDPFTETTHVDSLILE